MGNVTKDNLLNTYSYDAEGRPVSINSGWAQTLFDAFNREVETSYYGPFGYVSSKQILYSPTGGKFAIMNGQSVTNYFAPLAGGVQAVYNSSGLQYFRQGDWLGSQRSSNTTTGAMYYDVSYGPFGEEFLFCLRQEQ